jgi:hypothetical protein
MKNAHEPLYGRRLVTSQITREMQNERKLEAGFYETSHRRQVQVDSLEAEIIRMHKRRRIVCGTDNSDLACVRSVAI